jgi:hypothetical protein
MLLCFGNAWELSHGPGAPFTAGLLQPFARFWRALFYGYIPELEHHAGPVARYASL